jgi:CBS domain containing-hemolysin-like protein
MESLFHAVTSPFLYWAMVPLMGAALAIFSYLDRIYRELGRVTTGRIHANLDVFEAEVEPRLGMDRRRAGLTFSLLAQFWFVVVVAQTARGVVYFIPGNWAGSLELILSLTLEVLLGVHIIPSLLLARSSGRWLLLLLPLIRLSVWLIWPIRALLEGAATLAQIGESPASAQQATQEGMEQLIETAQEEGIIHSEQAQLIEQVVDFTDKRVREVMTPRPDVVAMPASSTLEELRRKFVETRFSRIPIFDGSLDDIIGIAFARDLLTVPEKEGGRRTAREIARPALFVPETKLGSQLLKEMQQKNQQMAMVIDEYGTLAGLVTVEDLVEEIVGEIGEEDRAPVPDVVREGDGTLLLRGSVSLETVCKLFGIEPPGEARQSRASTIAGLLNSLAGHVPSAGESYEFGGLRFEVLEANQRKVLRLRAHRKPELVAHSAAK